MARKFFYVCAGMLMLALSFHFGYTTARAQSPGNPAVGMAANQSGIFAITANGDTYQYGNGGPNVWHPLGNIFSGNPVPTMQESWGQLKSRYRAMPSATPGTTVTPGADNK